MPTLTDHGPRITDGGAKPRAYFVDRDLEGVRIAFLELLEAGFQRTRAERDGDHKNTPALKREYIAVQMEKVLRNRTLSSGYYTFCGHIFRLDAERSAGLPLDIHSLAAFEGDGLRTLALARAQHRAKHPTCSRCGAEQESRHHPTCTTCKADFTGKKGSR